MSHTACQTVPSQKRSYVWFILENICLIFLDIYIYIHIILYYITLYYITLYYIILYYIILHYIILYYILYYDITLHYIYNIILYYIIYISLSPSLSLSLQGQRSPLRCEDCEHNILAKSRHQPVAVPPCHGRS